MGGPAATLTVRMERLVADIEAGKVAHLLCKDLSRIGRNYLQTGFYTETLWTKGTKGRP